ncbi:MAG: CHAP domain-containing protein [Gemmatimonadaceae bacterium]
MEYSAAQAADEIIRVASHFLNLKETTNNAAWDDPDTAGQDAAGLELRQLLESVGWQVGWPYCMAFCKAVYMQTYKNLGAPPDVLRLIAQRFTSSVMLTHKNCGRFAQNKVPTAGAIFFMQKGDSGNGHAGLVVTPGQASFSTIEGNTSPSPASAQADREGDGVYKKVRTLDFTKKPGLWLRGFLVPLSSDEVAALRPMTAAPKGGRALRRAGKPVAKRRSAAKPTKTTRAPVRRAAATRRAKAKSGRKR